MLAGVSNWLALAPCCEHKAEQLLYCLARDRAIERARAIELALYWENTEDANDLKSEVLLLGLIAGCSLVLFTTSSATVSLAAPAQAIHGAVIRYVLLIIEDTDSALQHSLTFLQNAQSGQLGA